MGVENRVVSRRAVRPRKGVTLLKNVAFWLFALTGCFLVGVFLISPLINASRLAGGETPAQPSAQSPASGTSSQATTQVSPPAQDRDNPPSSKGTASGEPGPQPGSAPTIEVRPDEMEEPVSEPPVTEPSAVEESFSVPAQTRPYGEDTPVRQLPAVRPERPTRSEPRRHAPQSDTGSRPVQRGESLD